MKYELKIKNLITKRKSKIYIIAENTKEACIKANEMMWLFNAPYILIRIKEIEKND